MLDLTKIPFVQARHYTRANRPAVSVTTLGIHTMESQEKPTGAENVAAWFAGLTAPDASAHFCCDNNSIVQCVALTDVAWAAPHANKCGIHIELAGRAAQTDREWHDAYSKAELELAAKLCAALCAKFSIPAKWLSIEDVQAGRKGITSHANITRAYPGSGDHWDPGPNFPHAEFIARVNDLLRAK